MCNGLDPPTIYFSIETQKEKNPKMDYKKPTISSHYTNNQESSNRSFNFKVMNNKPLVLGNLKEGSCKEKTEDTMHVFKCQGKMQTLQEAFIKIPQSKISSRAECLKYLKSLTK
ncbi:hypothetical protein Glove_166g9 [Diversispora epigaea]|uniref:Uncharacterized protein n=1 Tax=Diversispora epigaea TaxID=1348612 RepID=A0A397IQR4_9GLOM|nr:hypothetical protein Glove_166g9 [Diversispora epigaea]